jgi:hypothetical protein
VADEETVKWVTVFGLTKPVHPGIRENTGLEEWRIEVYRLAQVSVEPLVFVARICATLFDFLALDAGFASLQLTRNPKLA